MDGLKEIDISEKIKLGLQNNGVILIGDNFSEKNKIISKIEEGFDTDINVEVFKLDCEISFSEENKLDTDYIREIFDSVLRMSNMIGHGKVLLLIIEKIDFLNQVISNNVGSIAPDDMIYNITLLVKIKNIKLILDDLPMNDKKYLELYDEFFV
ncbi:MAG: hypothetical protein HRU03_07825 [Nanoarchaeales archaeon]|nr:hypothetical protein [Nanoarchaeales archaeon]